LFVNLSNICKKLSCFIAKSICLLFCIASVTSSETASILGILTICSFPSFSLIFAFSEFGTTSTFSTSSLCTCDTNSAYEISFLLGLSVKSSR
jgi:hypothetical protein